MDPQPPFSSVPAEAAYGSPAPPKKKQKRNKPTLSCEECVERKTKVTRCDDTKMRHARCDARVGSMEGADGASSATAAGPSVSRA